MAPGLEKLSQDEWTDAVTRATDFAKNLRVALPRHLTVSDVVHTAVQQVLNGTRSFDPAKHSLAGVLCNTVKSIVSSKGLAEYSRRMPLASAGEQAGAVAVNDDDECLFSAADRDMIFARSKQEAGSNKLLVDYIDAFRANFSAEECAELLGVSRERVYDLQRQLKEIVVQILESLRPMDKPM